MEEKEMTKVFLRTLSPFYFEKMVASSPSDFAEMVNMGVRLEEAVREGRMTRDDGSNSGAKKPSYGFTKKKEQDANAISRGKPRRSHGTHNHQQQVASVAPVVNAIPATVSV